MEEMKKYKVEITETETFIIDVLAKNEVEAEELAVDLQTREPWTYKTNQDSNAKVKQIFDGHGRGRPV